MDQDQYALQHDYLSRLSEVPTKLVTLNKELDLLLHHAADIADKVQMLDDMILKVQDIEKRLGNIQYFLADDVEPIPGNPRDPGPTTFASEPTTQRDVRDVPRGAPLMDAPRGGIKYGRTV